MSDNSSTWQDVSAGYEQTQEGFFQEWAFFEQKFGEFGEPGFTEQTHPARFPGIFGHNDSVDVRFTLYRGEDGQLLFVHGCYIDVNDNNLQKPFVWNAHPDYQRQGIGTMVANYIKSRYEQENGTEFTYSESLSGTKYNAAGANFANKFVNNAYSEKNNI
jgi:hypothetical protein